MDNYSATASQPMKTQNIIEQKTFDFAVRIINLYKYLCNDKKEFVLSKQILKSGTSIGANVAEALQGQSKRDFLSKMNIALKEACETNYWLRLLAATDYLTVAQQNSLLENCREIEKILTAIIKKLKSEISTD